MPRPVALREDGELHHFWATHSHGSGPQSVRPVQRWAYSPISAPTIATVFESMGYANGQFGKNHLGDCNQFLPTVHGFDEFFGDSYHLDAMEDPCHRNDPQRLLKESRTPKHGSQSSWATDTDDPTVGGRGGERLASRKLKTPVNSVRSG